MDGVANKKINLQTMKIKIEPESPINLEHEKVGDWDFFWNAERMLTAKELDIISDSVKINRLPDMLFGYNRFYMVYAPGNFVLEINPLKMLDLVSYEERTANYYDYGKMQIGSFDKDKDKPNFVYYNPTEVKLEYYDKWKNIKIDRDDIVKLDQSADWTFSSSYMGNISRLTDNKLFITNEKCFKDFDIFKKFGNIDIKTTLDSLPLSKLGRDNPINKYMEINLFDDELDHNGVSQGNFR